MDSKKTFSRRKVFLSARDLFVYAGLLGALWIKSAAAGVLVAPTVVILNDRDRTGRITVQNPSEKAKEVSIIMGWGIPESDSLGNIQIALMDSGVTDPRCAMDWIKPFPEKFILSPGSSQVVRFRAKPPADLPPGEYWARIIIRSQEGEISIPPPADTTKINARLNMIMQTAIMIKYRTGDLIANLEVAQKEVQLTDSAAYVTIKMINKGNVSYVGTLNCRLLSADGQLISQDKIGLAVYYELTRRVRLPFLAGEFEKPYKVDISISASGRTDIPPEDIIKGNEISFTMLVE
jgi:P pilus assembly chaperone PapD